MPNWKKVITSGSDAILNQITASGGIDTPDITIDDWGSVSASLASIEAGVTSTTLQEVTDNGAINRRAPEPTDPLADWASTDVNIIITGSLVAAAPGNETQYAHLQGNSLDLGKAGSTDTYLKLNGQNGFLKIGPQGSTIDIYTDEDFINVFTSGSNTSYINSYNLNGPAGQTGTYIGQSLQLTNSYGGSGTSATFNLKHRAVGRIGPAGGSSVQYEYLTVQGANYNQNDDVEVNLFGDIIRMSSTSGSFGQNPRVQVRQVGTEVYGNLYVDGSGITGMDGLISAAGAITGSDVKITGFNSVSASLADLAGNIDSIQGSGYVDTSGTPADNQIAIFTDSNTIEGDSDVVYYSGSGTNYQVSSILHNNINGPTFSPVGIEIPTLYPNSLQVGHSHVGNASGEFTSSFVQAANSGHYTWAMETILTSALITSAVTNKVLHTADSNTNMWINYSMNVLGAHRVGQLMVVTNGAGAQASIADFATADIGGSTAGVTFSVSNNGSIVSLMVTTTTAAQIVLEIKRQR